MNNLGTKLQKSLHRPNLPSRATAPIWITRQQELEVTMGDVKHYEITEVREHSAMEG